MAGREVQVAEQVQAAGGVAKFIASYTGNLSRVAPKHIDADAFIGLAAAYVARSPQLMEAAQVNPAALVMALRECAALGHTVGKDTYVLTPFRNTKWRDNGRPQWDIVGVEVYKGVLERMFRAGGVQSVHVQVIRESDRFTPGRPGTVPYHDFPWDASVDQRGPLVGVYAWAVMLSGAPSHCILMNRHDVQKHRAASRSGDAFWGPAWPAEGPWTPDMWQKTALHKLEPYVPTSAAYRWEIAAANANGSGWKGVPDAPVVPSAGDGAQDIQDAEILDERGSQGTGADWPDARKPADAAPQQ